MTEWDEAKAKKPKFGDPCNGCGLCCIGGPCGLGQRVFQKIRGRCPALLQQNDRFVCGLMTYPERFAPDRVAIYGIQELIESAKGVIGSGIGCDSLLNEEHETTDQAIRKRLTNQVKPEDVGRAMITWGVE